MKRVEREARPVVHRHGQRRPPVDVHLPELDVQRARRPWRRAPGRRRPRRAGRTCPRRACLRCARPGSPRGRPAGHRPPLEGREARLLVADPSPPATLPPHAAALTAHNTAASPRNTFGFMDSILGTSDSTGRSCREGRRGSRWRPCIKAVRRCRRERSGRRACGAVPGTAERARDGTRAVSPTAVARDDVPTTAPTVAAPGTTPRDGTVPDGAHSPYPSPTLTSFSGCSTPFTRASNRSFSTIRSRSAGSSASNTSAGRTIWPDSARCCTRDATLTVCPK